MTAFEFNQNQKAATPEKFNGSPFTPGDRVNTRLGTGTIYQSGPYESWVVLDEDWVVHFVWTDFLKRLPGRIEGLQAGFPPIDHLRQAGYEVRLVDDEIRTLAAAGDLRRALEEIHPGTTYRIVNLGDYNDYGVVEATREDLPPHQPRGIG